MYTDNTLEEISIEEIEKRNEQLVDKIKAGAQGEKVLNGELVIKLHGEDNTAQIKGKEKFGFEVSMPFYDKSGELVKEEPASKMALLKPNTN